MLVKLRTLTHAIKLDVYALYLVSRDTRVPWCVKALAACVVVYALSPIDLIPDFVPVLGYLDDVIIVALGMFFAIRMVPHTIMAEHRASAAMMELRPCTIGAYTVAVIWILGTLGSLWLAWAYIGT